MRINWIYENDNNNRVRYTLGVKGVKSLLCFGINPSTAEPGDLDNTLKAVKRLAEINGYDSWIMMNIYPQRATDPNNIHKRINREIHRKNVEHIETILKSGTVDIWAAWGTLIEKRKFLVPCLLDIYEVTKHYPSRWITIGKKSKAGHPHHPLYLRSDSDVEDFDVAGYVERLR